MNDFITLVAAAFLILAGVILVCEIQDLKYKVGYLTGTVEVLQKQVDKI